jgi:hypothetical protein
MKNYDELIERLANAASNLRGTPGKALLVGAADALQLMQAENERLTKLEVALKNCVVATAIERDELRAKLAALQDQFDDRVVIANNWKARAEKYRAKLAAH